MLATERWFACDDPDVQWIMKQDLGKKRLQRAAAARVAAWKRPPAKRWTRTRRRPSAWRRYKKGPLHRAEYPWQDSNLRHMV